MSFLTRILLAILGNPNEYLTNNDNISGKPSPVTPEVGTNGI